MCIRDRLSERQPLSGRVLDLGRRIWRPAGTLVAFALALLLTWHVINGKHGLNVWLEKRAEDKVLQREIRDLNQENDRLRDRIEHLKTDPDTIMIAARQTLHYAKPDEVIVEMCIRDRVRSATLVAGLPTTVSSSLKTRTEFSAR